MADLVHCQCRVPGGAVEATSTYRKDFVEALEGKKLRPRKR